MHIEKEFTIKKTDSRNDRPDNHRTGHDPDRVVTSKLVDLVNIHFRWISSVRWHSCRVVLWHIHDGGVDIAGPSKVRKKLPLDLQRIDGVVLLSSCGSDK